MNALVYQPLWSHRRNRNGGKRIARSPSSSHQTGLSPGPASVRGPNIFLPHRGRCLHHPFGREDHHDFGALAKLGFQGEGSAVECDETLYDRQTEAGPFLSVFLRKPATPKRGHDEGNLVFRNSRTAVAHCHKLTAAHSPANSDLDEPALRGELDRVRQEVQHHLTKSTFVGPNPRQIRFDGLFHDDLPL